MELLKVVVTHVVMALVVGASILWLINLTS